MGIRPLALGGVWLWFWLCVWLFSAAFVLVFFSQSSCCVSIPFNDDLGTPPTRRPYSWKKKVLVSVCRLVRISLFYQTKVTCASSAHTAPQPVQKHSSAWSVVSGAMKLSWTSGGTKTSACSMSSREFIMACARSNRAVSTW